MLANVLKSGRAIEMSIKIIDVFVKLRELLLTNKEILLKMERLENKLTKHDEDIHIIFMTLKQLLAQPEEPQLSRRRIGFRRNGEEE